MKRKPPYEPKKNSLSCTAGPPTVKPKRCWLYGVFTENVWVVALKLRSRKNSNTEPWNWLVPDFVSTDTTPAELRPHCAEKLLVSTRNSRIASGFGSGFPVLRTPVILEPPSR